MITALCWQDGKPVALKEADIAEAFLRHEKGGFIWVHYMAETRGAHKLAGLPFELPQAVTRALLAAETRPRCDLIEGGLLVNLRAPHDDEVKAGEGDPLVSLRLWAKEGLLLSVSFRHSNVVPKVAGQFNDGLIHDPGDLIIALLATAAHELDVIVANIGDELDDLESSLDQGASFAERRRSTQLRSKAIILRRFIVPHSQAIDRLTTFPIRWIDDGERAALREASDRFARMGEELESVRERAAVLHDEITDLRAERMDARSLQIAIAALIFLPLTFVTGLLGMNVDGIPYAHDPWAFWGVTAFCAAIALCVAAWFAWRGWSQQ
ncbi:MAG: CorA family divalent cation transporter [Sphingopyxis sp.]